MADVRIDSVVDNRYRVLSRLGSGGMADVYCAEDTQLGRRVALKLLHRRFAEDDEFVERFRREASAAAGLQHPNVVAVYDRGSWDGTWYIAMEFLPGRSLKQLVREEGPLHPSRAIDITTQVLKAARFAHKRGVIHRDIKPHNVIVDDEDRVKVTDFGIARAGASDMTETGAIMGTAQYLSPEQAQGHAVSAASDLYSIGILLYELLTGHVPFDADSAVTIALKQVSEAPVPPRALNPEISPELEDVVLRALQKDPAARFAGAGEFMEALAAVRDLPARPAEPQRTGELTGVYPVTAIEYGYPDPVEVLEERDRRTWRFWGTLLVLLLALAAIAAGAYLLLKPEQVTVPRVVGLNADTAAAKLDNAGLDPDIESVVSRTVPRDQIARQDPNPGARVNKGSTVKIYVSLGPGEATIPRVGGVGRRTAERRLRAAGFRVSIREQSSDTVTRNRVIETLPPEGSRLEKGKVVVLVVSTGPERVEVPDVTQLSRDEAENELRDRDLDVRVVDRETGEEDPGQVLSQDPEPGSEVDKGTTVTLTVATEPQDVMVPDVEGKTLEDAQSELEEAGLRVRVRQVDVDDPADDEIVIRQNPPGGSTRRKDSRVVLEVGRFTPPDDLGDAGEPTPTPAPVP